MFSPGVPVAFDTTSRTSRTSSSQEAMRSNVTMAALVRPSSRSRIAARIGSRTPCVSRTWPTTFVPGGGVMSIFATPTRRFDSIAETPTAGFSGTSSAADVAARASHAIPERIRIPMPVILFIIVIFLRWSFVRPGSPIQAEPVTVHDARDVGRRIAAAGELAEIFPRSAIASSVEAGRSLVRGLRLCDHS